MGKVYEENRIREIYKTRDQRFVMGFRSVFGIMDSFYRDKALYRILRQYNIFPLMDKKIMDFGCGTCGRLRELIRFGAQPENLFGIDLSRDRIAICQKYSPNFSTQVGSCTATGYPDGFFDLVINSTMMSSVLDDVVAQEIATEMRRVLNPSTGIILWYDMRVDNPWNKDVRGYSRRMIQALFPDGDLDLNAITLASKFSSIVESAPFFYHLMHLFPFLRTHYIGVIKNCA